jgi:preprotein translocase subunit SecE
MTVEEDAKRGDARQGAPDDAEPSAGSGATELVRAEAPSDLAESEAAAEAERAGREAGKADGEGEAHDVSPVAPTQLGARRFVYAAYFAGAIGIAFLSSKVLDFAWLKVQSYKPAIGEPRDEVVMTLAALIGAGAAVYYWFRTRARELAEEVAAEMSKVTWPSRTEVTNGTVVVIVTTIVSTVFFALMDKFWGFITNLVYGGT